MARWQPGARERIVLAAVDLFTERGYDDTTVAQIAERAGITKSTFFRHFPDKRELLAAGQETLARLLSEGIAEAPEDASPLEAVAVGLERASNEMGPMNRDLGPRISAATRSPCAAPPGRPARDPRAPRRRHGPPLTTARSPA